MQTISWSASARNPTHRRCLRALRDLFAKFGLELHPEKTRLIEVRTLCGRSGDRSVVRKPLETFDFLGFTHICDKTRKGDYTVHRVSAGKKLRSKLRRTWRAALRRNMHRATAQVGA